MISWTVRLAQRSSKIVPAVTDKVKAAINNNTMVIFTKDTHYSNYLETAEGKNLPVEHCIKRKQWMGNYTCIK